MPKIERVFQEGTYWYPVPSAARLLGTNATKIRQLMGNGTLEWSMKSRGSLMLVSATSVEAYRASDANPKRGAIHPSLRSQDPLRSGLPKMGDRDLEAEERRRSDIFVRTWDPRAEG